MSLIERVESAVGADNRLDVLIEVALFEPCETYAAVRPNNAGTKVIYQRQDGRLETYWAQDWTLDRLKAAASLRARGIE